MSEITLTRKQLLRIITLIGVDARVESITIKQTHASGIGASHEVTYHTNRIEHDWKEDITDVEVW